MRIVNTGGFETQWLRPPLMITNIPIDVDDDLGKKILAQEKTIIEVIKKETKNGK